MTETIEIDPEKPPILTDTEKAVLNLVAIHPEMNPHQIANELIKLGKINSPQPVYKTLKKYEYMTLDKSKLRERIDEDFLREIYPLGKRELKKGLISKDLHIKDKLPFIKIAVDKVISDKEDRSQPINVNIESMQAIVTAGIPIKQEDQ